MGIAKRGGQCLKAIYLNYSELNIKFFGKRSRLVASKLTSTNSSVRLCFQLRTYWLESYLAIPWESPGTESRIFHLEA